MLMLAAATGAQETKGNFPFWQERGPIRSAFGVKAGFVADGNFYLNGVEYSNKFGLDGGAFIDVRVIDKFFLSPTIDLVDVIIFQDREILLDVSLAAKYAILSKNGQAIWRPTFSIGYGRLADIGILEHSNYLTVKSSCELIFPTKRRYFFMLELGVIGLPDGGNAEYEVRANPHLFLRGGVLY